MLSSAPAVRGAELPAKQDAVRFDSDGYSNAAAGWYSAPASPSASHLINSNGFSHCRDCITRWPDRKRSCSAPIRTSEIIWRNLSDEEKSV